MSVLFQKPMMNPPFKLEDWNECTLPKTNDEFPFKLEDWNECTLPKTNDESSLETRGLE